MMVLVRQVFCLAVSAWLILAFLEGVADARISTPGIDELVEGADLIVIGKVQSVRATPSASWRQIGLLTLLIASAAILIVLLWRRRVAIAVCLVVACLFMVSQLQVPFGTYRRLACVSVSSTIKGEPPGRDILVYYDYGFVCDVTRFAAGEDCLLFLKRLPTGYTVSWHDWSLWIIRGEYAETERMTWNDGDPVSVADLVTRIEAVSEKQAIEPGRLP